MIIKFPELTEFPLHLGKTPTQLDLKGLHNFSLGNHSKIITVVFTFWNNKW